MNFHNGNRLCFVPSDPSTLLCLFLIAFLTFVAVLGSKWVFPRELLFMAPKKHDTKMCNSLTYLLMDVLECA